ncbi:hypothetical protein C1J05_17870 [Sulfitobacter sp. JL08]|uniref:virulence-associated E family protein n=1 Tax=Sulfitobacter sp. JL08 TaxID=2070369 RepID=UPI000E0A6D03|nr:virulence-associated E family protein [Sulfitobacter sp. JL08]AXI56115.1 hypothetical protein C1J05_17870 [Sulfitobacter sp. JL08]
MKDAKKKKKDNNNVVNLKAIEADPVNTAMQELEANLLWSQTTTGTQVIKNAQKNYSVFMKHHPDLRGCFAFDEFDNQPILTAPIPGSYEDNGQPFTPRPFTSSDVTAVVQWLDEHSKIHGMISKEKAEEAMYFAADFNRGDRLKQYLETCAAKWDRKRRIEDLFRVHMVASDWNEYSKEMGEICMMAQVLRGLYPGAKLKIMPIIEGAQSIGKSPSLEALCPDGKMFGDSPPLPLSDTLKSGLYLRGKFLVELAEMAPVRKTDQNELKSYITRQNEEFIPKYVRNAVSEPRRCMIWGTTNEDTYLRDETGATRYYPIEVETTFPDKIREDRDQLLGEAVVALKEALDAGENWWELSPKAQEYLVDLRDNKAEDDPYTSVVLNYVEGLTEVTTREIVLKPANYKDRPGLGLDNHAGRGPGMQVAAILRKNGWRRAKKVKSSGPYRGQAVYLAPKKRS